jgi:5-methylcytosine-specific restriction endonuclease McrA
VLARVAPCGHVAPVGEKCPQCGTSPAEKAESQRKRSKQSYVEVYGTPRWKALRLEVLRRDKFRCQECGEKANQAAHIHPFTSGQDAHAWDPRNLKASCARCNSREASQRWHDGQGHSRVTNPPIT